MPQSEMIVVLRFFIKKHCVKGIKTTLTAVETITLLTLNII